MSKFRFKNLQFSWPTNLTSACYIWIWHPDRIPPHIGFSHEKNYYSLTYKASEKKLTSSMIRKAKRSQIPLLLVYIPNTFIKQEPEISFGQFDRAKLDGATCLTPIKLLNPLTEKVSQLADFLTVLESQHAQLQVFALHLESSYSELPHYTVSQIMDRINELNGAKK